MSFKTWLGCTCKRFECNGVYLSNMRMRETMNSRGLWSLKKKCTPSPSLLPHKLSLWNKIQKKLAMNNKRMTKKTMSNRRIRKMMSNMMVANWVHNLPEIDVKGLKRHSRIKSLKFQWYLVFWVWNFRTELETPHTRKLITFFEHKSLKKQETQKKLKLPPTSFNFKKKKTPYTLQPKLN